MKKIVLMMMVIGSVAASYGAIAIDWSASAGFYWTATGASLLGDASGKSTYAQLMYSPDGVQDAGSLTPGQGINTSGNGTGDDIFWARLTITENGVSGDFDDYAPFLASESRAYVAGNFYAVIFQDNDITGNDWYYYTPMQALKNLATGDGNQGVEMNTDLTNGNAIEGAQVVPEPATFFLLALGGCASWILRRMRMA